MSANYKGLMALPIKYNPKNKIENANNNVRYMLSRTRRMFKWKKLPDSIPERNLELMLQTNGHVCIAKDKGKLYAFVGSFGGVPNEYYLPTKYIVANPYLNLSKEYTIGKDCVIITNDSLYMGLLPMLSKYCNLIAETELTIDVIAILSRAALVMDAQDENDYKSAVSYVEKLFNGDLGIITRDSLIEENGVKVQPGASQSATVLTHLIELIQYLKASQFNELGLNANWNAKRESLTSSETLLNSDALLPFCDDMKKCREAAIEDIKKVFGEEWSVDYDSSWEYNESELELTEDQMKNGSAVTDEQKSIPEGGNSNAMREEQDETD